MINLEALQGFLTQSHGESLDVAHPADIKDVRAIPVSDKWHNSALKEDRYRDDEGDWHYDLVKGRICHVTHIDEYGEPMGEPKLVLQHKYGIPSRLSRDISVTAIKPNNIRGLKERFPTAFVELELEMLRKGELLPIVLLDSVPPEVIGLTQIMGVRTIRDFAEFTDAKVLQLAEKMRNAKLDARVGFVPRYLEAARERVGFVPEAPKGKKAA